MAKSKIRRYGLFSVNHNYDTVQYFYKVESWDYNGTPKYRVFIIDPDGIVYETLYKGSGAFMENFVIEFLERDQI